MKEEERKEAAKGERKKEMKNIFQTISNNTLTHKVIKMMRLEIE